MNLVWTIIFITILSCHAFCASELESHTDLMIMARDPSLSLSKKIYYLDFTRKRMEKNLSLQLKAPAHHLNLLFAKDPLLSELLLKSPWDDLQTEFYSTLHQTSFLARWNDLQKMHQFSDYGLHLKNALITHWSDYTARNENRFYLRWNRVGIKTVKRVVPIQLPFFLMNISTAQMLQTETHIPYADLLGKDLFNFNSRIPKNSPLERQEIAEKYILNKKISHRAVANGAKTIASLFFLSGHQSLDQASLKVSSFINEHCQECEPRIKNDFLKSAIHYVKGLSSSTQFKSLSQLTTSLCSNLQKNNYHWNTDRLKPTPFEILQDQRRLLDFYLVHKLKMKNKQALAKTLLSHDLGLLFLTNALNVIDSSGEPVGTKLGCMKISAAKDEAHLVNALYEAEMNIKTYISSNNQRVFNHHLSLKKVTSTLHYLIQTNQAATAEALATFPQGIGHVLKSLAEVDQSMVQRERWDNAITWGGAVVGIGLMVSGFFAPEGVAVLLSSASIVKGLASGSYYLVRSREEKKFFKEMSTAYKGDQNLTHDLLQGHFENYKLLKIKYIKEFSCSALEFAKLNHAALKSSQGNVVESQKLLQRAFEYAKTQGKDQIVDRIQDFIIQVSVNH